jgi:hypothetical protein
MDLRDGFVAMCLAEKWGGPWHALSHASSCELCGICGKVDQ